MFWMKLLKKKFALKWQRVRDRYREWASEWVSERVVDWQVCCGKDLNRFSN